MDVCLVGCCTLPSIFSRCLLQTQKGWFLLPSGTQTDRCLQIKKISYWAVDNIIDQAPVQQAQLSIRFKLFCLHAVDTTHRWFLLKVWSYFKFKRQWLHLQHNPCGNQGESWSLLSTVNCLEMSILFDSKWKKILNGYFLVSYTGPQFPLLSPSWRVHGMTWNFYVSPLCLNSVMCPACVPLLGSVPFATLNLGPHMRRCFQMHKQSPTL